MFEAKEGETFLMPSPHGQKEHLYVIIADLDEQIVIVNFTTKREGSDTTVLLTPDDHPFIKIDTAVSFKDALVAQKAKVIDYVSKHSRSHSSASENLLDILVEGAFTSSFTPQDVYDALDKRYPEDWIN